MPVCLVCLFGEFAHHRRPKVLSRSLAQVPDSRDRCGRIRPLAVVPGLAACTTAARRATPTEIGEWYQDAFEDLPAALGARHDALTGRLAQREFDAESNENPEPPRLPAAVPLVGKAVTADALYTQDPANRHLRRSRARYVLTVKVDRPELLQAMRRPACRWSRTWSALPPASRHTVPVPPGSPGTRVRTGPSRTRSITYATSLSARTPAARSPITSPTALAGPRNLAISARTPGQMVQHRPRPTRTRPKPHLIPGPPRLPKTDI